jgi:hypothetical protein
MDPPVLPFLVVPRWLKTEGQPDLHDGDQVFNRNRDYSLLLPLERTKTTFFSW